ncbi:MAG TPA: sensor histidine kinase [Candidatus Limnocylindrales bacterium]
MLDTRAGRRPDRPDLRRLKWVAVALPIAAVVAGEALRHTIIEATIGPQLISYAISTGIAIAAIVAFAVLMFGAIERSERETHRQNRELRALNAVSTAVQDQHTQDAVIQAALRTVAEATRATGASLVVYPADGGRPQPPTTLGAPANGATSDVELVELPLTTGSDVVGLLQLWLPSDAARDPLSTRALQNVSHQLGCAIQMRRLVDDLQRRRIETEALYDIAIQVSHQHPLADTLARLVRAVRELLAVDEVRLCLTSSASAQVTGAGDGTVMTAAPGHTRLVLPLAGDGAICISPGPDAVHGAHERRAVCPVRASAEYRHAMELPIPSGETSFGDIWVGRRAEPGFQPADRALLAGLADLASIAISAARARESERVAATVAERDRIARELHDSLAQVLGVTHLRLRALEVRPELEAAPAVVGELDDLADLTHEAYRDVREAILGLRETSQPTRGFVPSLSAYLEKFSRQSGVQVRLDARLAGEPDLAPASEVQLIRVIQEALANVRKHAGADRAVVRVVDEDAVTTIEVEDDGHGFDLARARDEDGEGYGLHTMRERMEAVGGSLVVESQLGKGTRVIARIPHEHGQLAAVAS